MATTDTTTSASARRRARTIAGRAGLAALAIAAVAGLSACETSELGADGESFTRADVLDSLATDIATVVDEGLAELDIVIEDILSEVAAAEQSGAETSSYRELAR